MDRRSRRRPQKARSRGKERKPYLGGARSRIPKRGHRQGEPERDQTHRRRGRPRAWEGGTARGSAAMDGSPLRSARRRRTMRERRRRSRSPGLAAGPWGGGKDLWRNRNRRDATGAAGGGSRLRLPVAARRSEKRRFRLLRAHAGRRSVVLRRPLPNGLSVATRAADCPGATRAPSHREFMAAVMRRRAVLRLALRLR